MDIIINCDMGEGFGLYKIGNDEEMMKFISVANVACGFHASDPNHMKKTVRMAKEKLVLTRHCQTCKDLVDEK